MKRSILFLVAVVLVISIVVILRQSPDYTSAFQVASSATRDRDGHQSDAFGNRGTTVEPADLAKLIDRADKLVVFQEPRDRATILFESSDRRDFDALKASIRVKRPERYLHCMCDGTPALVLYANGDEVGQITNHHAVLVRCNLLAERRAACGRGGFS